MSGGSQLLFYMVQSEGKYSTERPFLGWGSNHFLFVCLLVNVFLDSLDVEAALQSCQPLPAPTG